MPIVNFNKRLVKRFWLYMFTHYVCSAYEYTLYIPIYTYTFIVIYFIINYESFPTIIDRWVQN